MMSTTIPAQSSISAALGSSRFADPIDGRLLRERVACDAAERRAAADEPEQPFRLARVVDDVGKRPELADEEHAQDLSGDVERDRYPRGFGQPYEEHPEREQQAHQAELDDRQPPSSSAAAP